MSLFGWLSKKAFQGAANAGTQNRSNKTGEVYKRKVFEKRTDYAEYALSEHKNPYLEAVIGEMISNTVGGNGISITPQPLNESGEIDTELQKIMQNLWTKNKDKLDSGGRHRWGALNSVIAKDLMAGGECFLVKVVDEEIDNDVNFGVNVKDFACVPFINDGGYKDGISISPLGRALAYKFSNGEAEAKTVDASNVIHAACYHRSGDTRGYSQVAAACELSEDLKAYDSDTSKLVSASMRLSYWCISEKKIEFPAGVPVIQVTGKASDVDVKALSSQLTNTFSKEHRKNMGRSMCAAVGTGYGATFGEFDGSYSASRQEMIVAGQKDLARQTAIIDTAIKPIYEAFMLECLKAGLIKAASGDTFNARYVAPKRDHIDPLKAAKAVALKLATNQTTLSDVLASDGKDFDVHLVHLKDELLKLKEAGLQPNGIEALKWLELNINDDAEEE